MVQVSFAAKRHEVNDALEAIEYCFQQGWTDGLPVVPPTEARVKEFIEYAGRSPDEVVGLVPTRRRKITVEKVAINAVMAGCLPAYMPVVTAAIEAITDDAYNLHGSTASTGGSAQFIIVNGPLSRELNFNCGVNAFGPGCRANATVGRAVRLILMNVCGAVPGVLDKSTLGHPGKFTFCLAENEEASPWEPLHVERGFPSDVSTVTVFAAEGPHQVQNHISDHAEGILTSMADSMAALGNFGAAEIAVVLSGEHMGKIVKDGWTKQDVKRYLAEGTKRSLVDLKRGGKVQGVVEKGDESILKASVEDPDNIMVIVAGGGAGGFSAIIPPWAGGLGSHSVTKAIGVCVDCH